MSLALARRLVWMVAVIGWAGLAARPAAGTEPSPDVLRSAETRAALAYELTDADHALLDEIERGCFNFFWDAVDGETGLVKDRLKADVCSVAGVGFQLAALPIGVERGWITRGAAEERAGRVLRTLAENPRNRKHGVLLHFVDLKTGGPHGAWQELQYSTIDHALFLAGALVAAEYLGGDVAAAVDRFVHESNWHWYDVSDRGLITFGWRHAGDADRDAGDFRPYDWHIASDEERILYFVAAGSPEPDFAGQPRDYYRCDREVKGHGDMPPLAVSWNGSLFTYFFSHLFIDYQRFAADDPRQFGVEAPRIDWVENSRRAVLTHRQRAIDAQDQFKTLAADRWGFAPCTAYDAAGRPTYLVQALEPNVMNADDWRGGTVAPYAAGMALTATPAESLAALRAFRHLKDADGELLVWRGVDEFGLADSFNLDQMRASDDHVAIDAGPLLVAAENLRTGLIWRLFMDHPSSRRAVERLQWKPDHGTGATKDAENAK